MVKDDIKNGMNFSLRDGTSFYKISNLIYESDNVVLTFLETASSFFNNYDNDLCYKSSKKFHLQDIMIVYDEDGNLIWERHEINWHTLPVDTKLLVKHPKDKAWKRRYYAGVYDESKGLIYCYRDGKTSWVDKMAIYGWLEDNVRLWNGGNNNE